MTIKGKLRKNNRVIAGPEMGKPLPDGCEIELKLKPGERAIEARGISETRVTEDGCELEMEVGRPPESAIAPVVPPRKTKAGENRSASTNVSAGTESAGYGSVPASVAGWGNLSNSLYPNFSCTTQPYWPYQLSSEAGASIFSHWVQPNFPFCLPYEAHAYYNPLKVIGDNWGNLTGNFSWALYGPVPNCIGWLYPNAQVVRTWN